MPIPACQVDRCPKYRCTARTFTCPPCDEAEFARIVGRLGPRWHSVYEPLLAELMDPRGSPRIAWRATARTRWRWGSRGQEVKHPALEQFLAIQTRALVLAESRLLTPRSVSAPGVDDT